MSRPIGTYTFLPWLRGGVANFLSAADLDPNVKLRASVRVDLKLFGKKVGSAEELAESFGRDVQLYGPGDVVGIEPRAIVRHEPREWITNFEPNYFPFVEFYEEDFPWRYTPAKPDEIKHRLRPWVALVVLEEGEFAEGKNVAGKGGKDKPLPFITVDAPDTKFPAADELWAWAHVHVNRRLTADALEIASNDGSSIGARVAVTLDENPDLACARLVCPRKLADNRSYHAFLIPVFESGRLAGLGEDPAGALHATQSAWQGKPGAVDLPYYHRFFFRTGDVGDFEVLVRLLEPKPVDPRVGRRDIDVQAPDLNLPGILEPALGGVLRLGGALQVPEEALSPEARAEADRYEHWDAPRPHPFQQKLAQLVNLADDYATESAAVANANAAVALEAGDPDPLITPPLYGRWHATTSRLLTRRDGSPVAQPENWVHELNLDPRHRVTAGFGTQVVQANQEEYMNAAWAQIGEVLEANKRVRVAQVGLSGGSALFERFLEPLGPAQDDSVVAHLPDAERAATLLAWTAPVQKRIVVDGRTVHHRMKGSRVPPVVTSSAFRRAVRPRARLVKSLPFSEATRPQALIGRLAAHELRPTAPKVAPPGAPKQSELLNELLPAGAPRAVIEWLRRFPWLKWLALLLALFVFSVLAVRFASGLGGAALLALGFVAGALLWLSARLFRWQRDLENADSLAEANQTPEAVDRLPLLPSFVITAPGSAASFPRGTSDSREAVRFKEGLKDAAVLLQASREAGVAVEATSIDLAELTRAALAGIEPRVVVPRRTWRGIGLPSWVLENLATDRDTLEEVMAYPTIDLPMFKPLAAISSELFLPNINLIEPNSITLLETNQRFVEAYLVGLNHEFARELLWREYPTDQRGSYFRQFWDVSSFFTGKNASDPALKETLRDIPPIHSFGPSSKLGEHDHRDEPGAEEKEAVLVIRGELLKRYPNAVIYAHRAKWQLKNGRIDDTQERLLEDIPETEGAVPPADKVKTPLFEAKVDPDIYFFGFDLTVDEARGDPPDREDARPGWFFVIKERPGEPRFGLDVDKSEKIQTWNDLSWEDVAPGAQAGTHIRLSGQAPITVSEPTLPEDQEKKAQWQEDQAIAFGEATNSADLAYITYQAPVLVAIHASEMLPKGNAV